MQTHADKTQVNKSQSVSNGESQIQSDSESTFQFVDNRPEAIAQGKLHEMANNIPQPIQLGAFQDMANNSPQVKEAAQLRAMADNSSSQQQQPIQKKASSEPGRKENNTGLPDNLKTGMENLSGISLDKVKVHRNSAKPAQLQTHAHPQGTGIDYSKHQPQNSTPGTVPTTKGAGSRTGTIQRYTVHDQYMVSENSQFAVREHGTPQSQMFVDPGSVGDVATLSHIEFEGGAQVAIDSSNYVRLHPKYKSEAEKAQMEKMYCGKFSRHVTGKNETEKSGDAPKGRSLYMEIEGPASAWENHYAPVILEDGGDRGTFETAVGLDYIFFGIYGQEVEQSFAFKTEIAGMALGLQNDVVLTGLELQRTERLRKGEDVTRINREITNIKEERALAQNLLAAFQQGGSRKWGQNERQKATAILQQIRESHQQCLALEAEMREQETADRERREWNAKLMKIGLLAGIILVGLAVLLAML